MKKLSFALALAIAATLCIPILHAADMTVDAVMSFNENTPELVCSFDTKGSKKGDQIRGVWIAEDVGKVAAPNTKIDEATMTADEDDFDGTFSLSKPENGWPVGKYRVEIYKGDKLVQTVKFVVIAAENESEDDSGND